MIHGILFSSGAAGSTDPLLGNLLEDTITLSVGGIPVAIGFAVLKYRLYDIELLINRALVYGSRGASPARRRGFYPCDRRPVQPCETAHSVVHR